ncbi:MAG: penicillin-binding transpeptidase domain-containing protein [Acidimicrobiales bacterium]
MILIVAVVVVLVATAAAVVVPRVLDHPVDPVTAQAEAFLSAWSKGDTDAMQQLVSDPNAHVADDLHAAMGAVELSDQRYHFDQVTVADGVTTVDFTADVTVGGLGPWSYPGHFTMTGSGRDAKVEWSPAVIHPQLKPGLSLVRTRAWADRAPIQGKADATLVGPVATVTVGIEPRRMTDQAALTQTLVDTLQVDPATVAKALTRPGVKPDQFVPIIEIRRDRYDQVKPIIYPVPGLVFKQGTGRGAPSTDFARQLLGRTGEITAEKLTELGAPYEAGDRVGLSGLEAAYERSLAGTPTGDVHTVDASGATVEVLQAFPGTPPKPLRTTIDPVAQAAAQAALAGVTQPAAVVAMDGSGAIRAVVSTPIDQADRALAGQYPPGSTFKIVTTDALLTAGTKPTDTLPCDPDVTVDGRRFQNFEAESYGPITLTEAFAKSCNTAFINGSKQLSAAQLRTAAGGFGFGATYDIGIDSAGATIGDPKAPVDLAATAIGQGDVLASPMHMASVAAAVMSGSWDQPVLLPDEKSATVPQEKLDPAVQAALTDAMKQVVTGGTGTAAQVRNQVVAGKTGTAEFGSGDPPATHAWFVGFRGDLAVAVLVEGGGVGGQVAAPVAARFFAATS